MLKDSFHTDKKKVSLKNGKYMEYNGMNDKIRHKNQLSQKYSKDENNFTTTFPNFSDCPQMQRYEIISVLGMGAFATAYLAIDKIKDSYVAIKFYYNIKKSYLNDAIKNEAEILSVLNHPNIVKLHKMVVSEEKSCLVLELCPDKSLLDLLRLRTGKKITEKNAKIIMIQILDA